MNPIDRIELGNVGTHAWILQQGVSAAALEIGISPPDLDVVQMERAFSGFGLDEQASIGWLPSFHSMDADDGATAAATPAAAEPLSISPVGGIEWDGGGAGPLAATARCTQCAEHRASGRVDAEDNKWRCSDCWEIYYECNPTDVVPVPPMMMMPNKARLAPAVSTRRPVANLPVSKGSGAPRPAPPWIAGALYWVATQPVLSMLTGLSVSPATPSRCVRI